jgi:dTDP-4-dehydrorhamnose 3,5-epimerase
MKVTPLALKGLLLIEPVIFTDERGYFFESFNEDRFRKAGIDASFVQDNHSLSSKGVLRGLHFQKPPFEQGKLVRVAHGSVLDVVVDIRKQSPDFGKCLSMILSSQNNQMLWIPQDLHMDSSPWKMIRCFFINARIPITKNLKVVSYGTIPI